MRQIFDGLIYDTDTARELLDLPPATYNVTDFRYEDTTLYATPNGKFFLAGKGGPMTRWARSIDGGRTGGSGIEPLSRAEAVLLVEQHGSVELYTELFGEPTPA